MSKLKEWRNAQMRVLRQNRFLTDEDQINWYNKISNDKTQAIFARLEQDNFIGYCALTNIDSINKRAEISFLADPKRVSDKKTYKEDFLAVLEMLCKYSFEKSNLNKIFTETFEFRKYHISILEKFGFRLDGKLRKHVFKNGAFYDSLIHSMLASEWRGNYGF